MNLLLIISIIIFCLLLNKQNLKNSFLISLTFIFSPILIFQSISLQTFLFIETMLILLLVSSFIKNTLFQNFFYIIIFAFTVFSLLFLENLINNKLQFDWSKFFFIDNSSLSTIKSFQLNALYLPRIIRNLVFNDFQIILNLIGRILNIFWIDNFLHFLGFGFFYFLFLTFKKIKFPIIFITITVFTISALHRNPNTSLTFLSLIPFWAWFFAKNIKKIKISFLIPLLIVNFFYILL